MLCTQDQFAQLIGKGKQTRESILDSLEGFGVETVNLTDEQNQKIQNYLDAHTNDRDEDENVYSSLKAKVALYELLTAFNIESDAELQAEKLQWDQQLQETAGMLQADISDEAKLIQNDGITIARNAIRKLYTQSRDRDAFSVALLKIIEETMKASPQAAELKKKYEEVLKATNIGIESAAQKHVENDIEKTVTNLTITAGDCHSDFITELKGQFDSYSQQKNAMNFLSRLLNFVQELFGYGLAEEFAENTEQYITDNTKDLWAKVVEKGSNTQLELLKSSNQMMQ